MVGKKERELQENIKQLQQNIELVDDENVKNTIMDKVAEKQAKIDVEMV